MTDIDATICNPWNTDDMEMQMFEIGKTYSFTVHDDGQVSHFAGEIVDWQAPLLKLTTSGEAEVILNTSSSAFIRAKPYEPSVYETRGLITL
ncbi:hypothetical protein IWC96_13460 [Brevundimonas sp. BAL450]|uniref:hypothetical protein n=1 Tax=Brevundimonas TaxID=41275 RepID=UPI0011D21FCC|nr:MULTISPECIES: hypothetical protein [Brevundimonas]MBG7616279.1 hypothetical protein [Brevundimonas sp. BAL450]